METSYTFKRDERLKSKKAISALFEEGNSFYCFPFRVLWMDSIHRGHYPVQVAVSVSKKNFKKAVHRNRIKRLMREAWRLNKNRLYSSLEEHNKKIIVMLVFTGNKIPAYKVSAGSMEKVVSKLLLLLQGVSDIEKPDRGSDTET